MYKFLLCGRYLRTRYIALVSIISVALGVGTMIVVNSVMSGFSVEMHSRLKGIFSDVVVDSTSINGFPDPARRMKEIQEVAGDSIEAMTPTIFVPAVIAHHNGEQWVTRPIQLIGIDTSTQGQVSRFAEYLQHPKNREHPEFILRRGGYDTVDHQSGPHSLSRPLMKKAGWEHRLNWAQAVAARQALEARSRPRDNPANDAAPDPFANRPNQTEDVFDPAKSQCDVGVIIGMAMGSFPGDNGDLRFYLLPGDDVKLYTLNASDRNPKFVDLNVTIVDFYESKMSEYDSQLVFMPLDKLQEWRGMLEPNTGLRYVNSIQIKLKPGVDGREVRDRLRKAFSPYLFTISTWQDKQGPLLDAVNVEIAILNVLLFLIIAVAGFGILAIFLMIVVEKTRDIGILKSLGASRGGVMGIFLGYGLSLGVVGSGAGLALGLLFVRNIDAIANWLSRATGLPIFDPKIYYFYSIPTVVNPWTIAWIILGAMVIAVLASVLPAFRAAMLHPVEALRYE